MSANHNLPETGRTLLELLFIIVMMAIVAVGVIAGYRTLSSKVSSQTVSKTIERHVVERRHEAMTTKGHTPHEVLDKAGPHGVMFDIANDIENNLIVIKTKSQNKSLIQALSQADILRSDAYSIDAPVISADESFVVMRFKQYPNGGLDIDSAITCAAGEVCDACTDSTKPVWDGVKCVCNETSCNSGYCESSGECAPCRDVPNFLADGSESQSGTMCCPKGYSSAVDGTCCSDSAPYCKEVNYLQSSGTQYIDTEYSNFSKLATKIEFNIQAVTKHSTSSWHYVFGAYNGTEESLIAIGFPSNPSAPSRTFRAYGSGTAGIYAPNIPVQSTDPISGVIQCTANQYYISVNNSSYTTSVKIKDQTIPLGIYLFGLNRKGSFNYAFTGRIFSLKILNSDTLVRDFIPVIDKKGKAGMYDKVENKVYYNQGTGKFSAG